MKRIASPDLVRPLLADDVARVAVLIERLERKVRDLKTQASITGYELLDLRIEMREAIAALEAHDFRIEGTAENG